MAGSVQDVLTALHAHGVVVKEWPGWIGRGNGSSHDWRGGIVHHTATPYGSAIYPNQNAALANGRPDLQGPLCNFAGNADGTLTIIADGVANHAGASGGYAMGPLPTTSNFNRLVMGLEIVYPGTSPMTNEQYHTACIWARVVADVAGGGNIESIRAHAETSITGKWDPGDAPGHTINMAQFRADAKNIFSQPPEPVYMLGTHQSLPLEYGAGAHKVTIPIEVGSISGLVETMFVGFITGHDAVDNLQAIFVKGNNDYPPPGAGSWDANVPHVDKDTRVWWKVPSGCSAVSLTYTCVSDSSRPGASMASFNYKT